MARFRMNRKLRSELSRQPEFRAMLRDQAEVVKESAEREAPVGVTEDYIHAFKVFEYPTMMRVGNLDFAAHWVEWGSVNNPPYAPLRRGVRAAGLRFDEHDKAS